MEVGVLGAGSLSAIIVYSSQLPNLWPSCALYGWAFLPFCLSPTVFEPREVC